MDMSGNALRRALAKAGYEALEPYPGVNAPHWAVQCVECGRPNFVAPRDLFAGYCPCSHDWSEPTPRPSGSVYSAVWVPPSQGEPESAAIEGSARFRRAWERINRNEEQPEVNRRDKQEARLRAQGYRGWPSPAGVAGGKWLLECVQCGGRRLMTSVYTVPPCPHQGPWWYYVSPGRARAVLLAAGWVPLVPLPGRSPLLRWASWRVRCVECLEERRVALSDVRRGLVCGHPARSAEEVVEAAGLLPEEPYPGSGDREWRVLCVRCGLRCVVTVDRVRRRKPGGACKHEREIGV